MDSAGNEIATKFRQTFNILLFETFKNCSNVPEMMQKIVRTLDNYQMYSCENASVRPLIILDGFDEIRDEDEGTNTTF